MMVVKPKHVGAN